MSVELSALRPGPELVERYPILTDDEVQSRLHERIGYIYGKTIAGMRFAVTKSDQQVKLFTLTANEYSLLSNNFNLTSTNSRTGLVERDRMQQIGLSVMQSWGADFSDGSGEVIRDQEYTDVTIHDDLYRSNEYTNLAFRRETRSMNGSPVLVGWYVHDYSTWLRFNPIRTVKNIFTPPSPKPPYHKFRFG